MIARIVAVAAGVWLMFSPAVLGYGDPAAVSDRIFGPLGASFAFVAIWAVTRSLRWMTVPVGLWLVAAPFVLGYDDIGPAISSVLSGVVLAGTAPLGGEVQSEFGGGWPALIGRRE